MEILRQLGYTIEEEKIGKWRRAVIYKQHILAYLLKTEQTYAIFGECIRKFLKTEARVILISNIRGLRSACRPHARRRKPRVCSSRTAEYYYLIPRLVESGLKGIEYNHPSHDEAQRKQVQRRAEEFGLLMTGGSDFHGAYERIKSKLGAYPAHESSRALFQRTRP